MFLLIYIEKESENAQTGIRIDLTLCNFGWIITANIKNPN